MTSNFSIRKEFSSISRQNRRPPKNPIMKKIFSFSSEGPHPPPPHYFQGGLSRGSKRSLFLLNTFSSFLPSFLEEGGSEEEEREVTFSMVSGGVREE